MVSCTEEACVDGAAITACPEQVVNDGADIDQSYFEGDKLVVGVLHGGGCGKEDDYALCYRPGFSRGNPVGVITELIHDSHEDGCQALESGFLTVDMSPLADLYEAAFGEDSGLIETSHGTYAFGELSCQQLSQAASAQMSESWSLLQNHCYQDSDCLWVSIDTACSAGCGAAIGLSGPWVGAHHINQDICADYVDAGCGPLAPQPCPPPGGLACVDERCVEVH